MYQDGNGDGSVFVRLTGSRQIRIPLLTSATYQDGVNGKNSEQQGSKVGRPVPRHLTSRWLIVRSEVDPMDLSLVTRRFARGICSLN